MLRYFDFSAAMLHVFNKVAEHRRVAYLELVVVATGKYALHCTAPTSSEARIYRDYAGRPV